MEKVAIEISGRTVARVTSTYGENAVMSGKSTSYDGSPPYLWRSIAFMN